MGAIRLLRDDERLLVESLLSQKPNGQYLVSSLANIFVEEMDDGGMGSLRFCSPNGVKNSFGSQLIERNFLDADGVPISVAINLDKGGALYELDIWKVDFTRVVRFPSV